MSPIVQKALAAITDRTNLNTGLTHPNDLNAAKEMFVLLYQAGEHLSESEIRPYAVALGWLPEDAKKLAKLGAEVGGGKRPRIKDGPWWNADIIVKWQAESKGDGT